MSRKLVLASELSMDVDFSNQVLKAIELMEKLLLDQQLLLNLFRPIAQLFVNDITDPELLTILQDYILNDGVNILVEQFYFTEKVHSSAIMKTCYHSFVCNGASGPKLPYVIFDAYLASFDRGNRQCYLHFVKLLHELTHVLTPGFVRLSISRKTEPYPSLPKLPRGFTTPTKIGPIAKGKGDAGSGFEDIVFGGRVLLDLSDSRRPYERELQLKVLPYPDLPPTSKGNDSIYVIKDEYVNEIIQSLDIWFNANGPFPSLKIPETSLSVVKLLKFPSRDVALNHFQKNDVFTEEQAPKVDVRKRLFTALPTNESARENERLAHSSGQHYSDYDIQDIQGGGEDEAVLFDPVVGKISLTLGGNEDDEELEDEGFSSVLHGGISKEQLQYLENHPYERF